MVNERSRPFESIGRFQDLTGSRDSAVDLETTFQSMAALLDGSGITGTIQFHVVSADQEFLFMLVMNGNGSAATRGTTPQPDVEVFVALENWLEIAKGAISPIEAAGRGQIRVRGKYQLALKAAAQLTANPRGA